MIVLVGFMGAGKTSVGRALAGLLGEPFIDTDDLVVERADRSIPEIFATEGEGAFRRLERAAASEALERGRGVVALGGGALGDEGTRAALGRAAAVVHLDVTFDEAMRRVGRSGGRPMLAARAPRDLYTKRRPLYEAASTVTIPTDGRSPEEVARTVAEHLRWDRVTRIPVGTPSRSYTVIVGSGLFPRAAEFVGDLERAEKAFVVTHPELRSLADEVARGLGIAAETIEVPAGEGSKSLDVAGGIYRRLAQGDAHRSDVVVGVGGGVVTDLAAFVASTYNRGMRVALAPTSTLAQVDAAIGGKTGVNLPEGKNLVGTFHQPVAVLCDVAALASLPDAEHRAGLAEVVKYGLIADAGILEFVAGNTDTILARDEGVMAEVVARSVTVKAEVVAADEREAGRRAILNYGHTFGHAIERCLGYGNIRHGEAVAVGMMAAAWLARLLDRIDDGAVDLHRTTLEGIGLPTAAPVQLEGLERAWKRDKKYDRGVRFVLLSAVGRAEHGVAAPRDAIAAAVDRVTA